MHEHRVHVRYAETDQMGVVHHAAYVPWLEEARIAAMKDLGCSYRELEQAGIMMPVVELELQYRRPLHFDDAVAIRTTVAVLGPSRVAFSSELVGPDGQLRACGRVVVAACTTAGRPTRIPDGLLDMLGGG
ncbi:MAG: acyl-CoA thioesterase [Planctomycetota bacterium]